MAFIVTVRDAEGQGVASVLIAHHCYLMPDGTERPVLTQVAWCRTCRRFEAAERLPTAEEWRREVADGLRARLDDQPAAFVRDAIDSAWRAMGVWLEWRAGRRSPPRCMECGAADLVPIADWDKPVPHPAGTGMVVVSCRGHASMGRHHKLYTPEGLRIHQTPSRGTAPADP